MAGKTLQPGDKVTWNTSQGETHGTVKAKVTGTDHIKGHTAKASPEHPEYKVKSDRSGKEAIHKPEALQPGRTLADEPPASHARVNDKRSCNDRLTFVSFRSHLRRSERDKNRFIAGCRSPRGGRRLGLAVIRLRATGLPTRNVWNSRSSLGMR